tara:strand:- start:1273 stop:1779 length:507 start_codon:yes stop_codon:yes gene_type:complete
MYDAQLSLLFGAFVSNSIDMSPALRAYGAVRTFEGRTEMLRASSETYFSEKPHLGLQNRFKPILKDAKNFSPRRNEIAHGVVDRFQLADEVPIPVGPRDKCALFPPYATFKDRDVRLTPLYCYGAPEILYFEGQFNKLMFEANNFAGEIFLMVQRDSSARTDQKQSRE